MKTLAAERSVGLGFVADLVALAKPRITFMVLCTTLGGLWIAPGQAHALLWLMTILGVGLVVGGANALNMYLERDIDGLMSRTRNRPLPAGRLRPEVALAFGLFLGALGLTVLATRVNLLTTLLAAFSYVTYVWVYTPLKRRSTAALLVGAIPGAMPPLLGWTAATGGLQAPGQALFLILFVWQLPHFIAISLFRKDEYERAGLKIVPTLYGVVGARQRILLYSLLLLAVSLQPVRVALGGAVYLFAALGLGSVLLVLVAQGFRKQPNPAWARNLFLYTLIYLPALFLALGISVWAHV
jgi:protoheme IX farnesyltransferase